MLPRDLVDPSLSLHRDRVVLVQDLPNHQVVESVDQPSGLRLRHRKQADDAQKLPVKAEKRKVRQPLEAMKRKVPLVVMMKVDLRKVERDLKARKAALMMMKAEVLTMVATMTWESLMKRPLTFHLLSLN